MTHLVSVGQEGGQGVVDRKGVTVALQLEQSASSSIPVT